MDNAMNSHPNNQSTGHIQTTENCGDFRSQRSIDVSDSKFSFSTSPNFEDIRKAQEKFVDDRNWDQFHKPINLLLAMTKEVGEVAELFQWKDRVEEGLTDWTEDEKTHLAQELSDVYIYLQSLAEKCHVDLPRAVMEKMKKNALKYPIEKAWGSSKKYTEYQ